MWQSLIADYQLVDKSLFFNQIPADKVGDFAYMLNLLDWEANVDPHFMDNHFLEPRLVGDAAAVESQGCMEKWIVYGNDNFSAKELTVLPGRTVTVKDPVAYGLLCVQGYGRFGAHPISSPNMIRFGEMTEDEAFVTYDAARAGVTITNNSTTQPLVILKHYNPGHPEMPRIH
jgi:hypothetical protein